MRTASRLLPVEETISWPGLDLFGFAREVEELVGHRVDIGTEVHQATRKKVEAQAVAL